MKERPSLLTTTGTFVLDGDRMIVMVCRPILAPARAKQQLQTASGYIEHSIHLE